MLTSYFANYRKFPKDLTPVSISRIPPQGFKGLQALELAPSKELLADYKAGSMSEEEYTKRYKEETLSRLHPKLIAEKYPDGIFLCYEKTGDFCHRHIFSEWMREAGYSVFELANSEEELTYQLKIITGDIFNSKMQTIVNPVNCVGVMGAGLAKEFKTHYPDHFKKYKGVCDKGLLSIGKLMTVDEKDHKILLFPTKKHYKNKSTLEDIEAGLKNFVETYKKRKITSVAFPLLGTGLGGLNEDDVFALLNRYLYGLDIPVEIYRPTKSDKNDAKLAQKLARKKISVTGSRDFTDYSLASKYINRLVKKYPAVELVSGGARGADSLAFKYAQEHKQEVSFSLFEADWDQHGKRAGMIRNAEMAKYVDMGLVFWDEESPGTKHYIDILRKQKKEVFIYSTKKGKFI